MFKKKSTIYDTVKREAFKNGLKPKSEEARTWYRRQASSMYTVDRAQVFRETQSVYRKYVPGQITFQPGTMLMFYYDAKHKDTLPYWDKFPLIIAMDRAPGGFRGLNLHYLPIQLRAQFLDALMDITTNSGYDNNTKIKMNYQLLIGSQKYAPFKPCYKRYLWSHQKSKFAKVHAEDWEIAAFLPTAHWQKQPSWNVYHDSRKKMNG
jgi:hypothetical protein